jgi:hypothetical protein
MANSTSHIMPYPIKNCRFTLAISFRTSAGTPTDPTTPDTEVSSDGGATFADTTEEITTGGANGAGYLTLTSTETNNNVLIVAAKSANCLTTPVILYPRVLASVGTGTLSAGSAGGGTLGTLLTYDVTGCFLQTTGGTGGAAGSLQVRKMVTYNVSTGAFTVTPNWETTPDATTTYNVLLPEGVTLGMLKTLNPTTAGRTLDVAATGEAGLDFNNILSTSLVTLNSLTITGATTLTGAVSLGSTLGITGTTTIAALTTTGTVTLNALTVSNALIVTGTTTLTGAVSLGSTLGITGTTTLSGLTMTTLVTTGTATFNAVTVTGAFTVGTNALPWNASWDAEVQSEVDDAIVARNLQFLVSVAGTSDSGSTTTMVDAARTEGDPDYWKGQLIVFTSGTLAGQSAVITDFNAATDTFTLAPPLTQAVATHTYAILPNISVWDDTLAEHLASGTTGNALNAAGAAGDPWSTALPGAYGAGTAGRLVGRSLPDIVAGSSGGLLISGSNSGTTTLAALTVTGSMTVGTNAIPWNASWDAEVQSEAEDAIVVHRLDELLNADSDIDGAAPPTVGSVFHELMTKTTGSFTFDQTTDSLEAIRDRGDSAWITATGFSTHTAADVWAVATRTLTAATNITSTGGTITVSLGSVSVYDLTTAAKSLVQTEAEDALVTHRLDELLNADSDIDGAAPPTVGSVFHELMTKTTGSFTFDQTTDSLEALRDRGDAAWITAVGFSTHTAADIWSVATRTLTAATNITSTGGTITVSSGSVSVYDFTTAAKALLQTEADDALVAQRLDELLNADSDIDGAAPPAVGSVLHELLTKTTGSFTFDQTTDSLEAIRDRGDAAWGAGAVPSAASIADAVWDELIADHLTAGTTGLKLNSAASAGDPWSTTLPGSYAAGTAGYIVGNVERRGAGSVHYEMTITTAGGAPIDGVEVYVTSDSGGSNVVAGTLYTDALGKVTFQLDPGVYYRFAQKSGYNFTNPKSFTVT